jgi:rubrerythrin
MLERRVAARLKELSGARDAAAVSAAPDVAAAAEDEMVKYLLDVVPYVTDYYKDVDAKEEAAAGGRRSGMGALAAFCSVDSRTQRNEVYHKYLLHVEKDVANVSLEKVLEVETAVWSCKACGTALLLDPSRDELACPTCGTVTICGDMQLTYDQEMNSTTLVTSFSYKRLNHLTETLNAVCGMADVDVPQEVVAAVRAEYMRLRALTRDDITPRRTRAILKKLRLNKHYEHSHVITMRLNGQSAPSIPRELFQSFQRMFLQTQKPFERVAATVAPDRRNFLSYTYTCYQLSILLGRPDLCQWFPLLKSATKLYEQDVLWKAICAELGWVFTPTC